ncbi:family 20 glycosylhydrolase [Intrasporangium sp.]|uniref:beta-N-acetylhexosaminidase n=1 Tax=Intrasporangium sp. TaxID=1925024 RepID=UPI0032218831
MTLPVVPAPARCLGGAAALEIRAGLAVTAGGPGLASVVRRFVEDVRLDCGIALEVVETTGAGPAVTVELGFHELDSVPAAGGVRADGAVPDGADERHGIRITPGGVRVWGATAEAAYRGLTTLRQLISAAADDGAATLPTATILDGPRFAWRGLSLDVARTFHGPEQVRRVIDMCSLFKLNVLHLHLTDDQGWRIEIPSRPALTTIGGTGAMAGRPGGWYSQADLAELVAYAGARFVTLVPEIDMPGHTGAVFRSYPQLAPTGATVGEVAPGLALGTLDPHQQETWAFVEDVLDGVIAQFPQSAYVHIGGDEAFGMPDADHAAFIERVAALVKARGRRVVGWQEIARASLRGDELVQYWMEPAAAAAMVDDEALRAMVPQDLLPLLAENLAKAEHDVPRALGMGARLLISPVSRLYFDSPQGDGPIDSSQAQLRAQVGLPVYPAMSLRHGVEWDPVQDTPGVTGDEQIAGVEAAIWCETIPTGDALEFLLLPRLGGLAEKAWARPAVTEWTDYAARLAPQPKAWAARGWTWFAADSVPWTTGTVTG